MKLCWICPTWNRPECLRNLVRQFLAQDYPRDKLQLIILDDAEQYETQNGDRWKIVSLKRVIVDPAFSTLPAKYNALLKLVPIDCDAVVIAEDDDDYHPLHTAACAAALRHANWCKPSRVRSDFAPSGEPADGRFHASLAMRRDWLMSHGGWPISNRADFDQQLIAKLTAIEPPADPLSCRLPGLQGVLMRHCYPMTYTFRWGSSGHTHAQAYTRGPDDCDWLQRARGASGPVEYVGKLFPDEQASETQTVRESCRERMTRRDLSQFAMSGSFDGES